MAREELPPEQVIRDWLDANGPTTVGLDAIAETWRLERLGAADRRRIGAALEGAGVVVEPPLARAGARDRLRLSVVAPATASGPAALAEPAADPAPTPAEPAADARPTPAEPAPVELTPQKEASPKPAPERPAPTGKRPLAARLAPLAIALMVIGALGPWSKAVFVADYGTERAGWVVLAVAVVAALLLIVHASRDGRSVAPLVVAVLGTFAVALVASELRGLSEDEFLGPAWGVYVAFVGSAGLVLSSVALLARRS